MKCDSPENECFIKKGEYLFHQGDLTRIPFIIRAGKIPLFNNETIIEFDLEPTETIVMFYSLACQNFIKQKYLKITVLQHYTIEEKARKI